MRKNNYITSLILLTTSLMFKHLFCDFLLSLIMPLILIFILLIINLMYPKLFDFYKKSKKDKNYIIRLIINYLIIYIIIYLIDSFFISLIYSIVLLCFIILNKLYLNKYNLFKSCLISILPIIFVIIVTILISKIIVITKWNKIKDDYKLINNKVLEYKEEICKIDDCLNIDILIDLDNPSNKINFTKKELESINKIKYYYPTQKVIEIYNDKIIYGVLDGYVEVEIIYLIDDNKPSYNRNVNKLENNWYKLEYMD